MQQSPPQVGNLACYTSLVLRGASLFQNFLNSPVTNLAAYSYREVYREVFCHNSVYQCVLECIKTVSGLFLRRKKHPVNICACATMDIGQVSLRSHLPPPHLIQLTPRSPRWRQCICHSFGENHEAVCECAAEVLSAFCEWKGITLAPFSNCVRLSNIHICHSLFLRSFL